ncbi:MAG: aminotransferase class IV [Cyanobacteria bacterium P01_H01_bin.74]
MYRTHSSDLAFVFNALEKQGSSWVPVDSSQQVIQPLLYGYGCYTSFRLSSLLPGSPAHCHSSNPDDYLNWHKARLIEDSKALALFFEGLGHLSRLDILTLFFGQTTDVPQCDETDKKQGKDCVIRLNIVPNGGRNGNFTAIIQARKNKPIQASLLLTTRSVATGFQSFEHARQSRKALRLKSIRYQRPFAGIKLNALAEPLLFRQQALADGFDDVLFINPDGSIAESSTSSLVVLNEENRLITPSPKRDFCLPSSTVAMLQIDMRAANSEPINKKTLMRSRGVFLCNAVSGFQPVSQLDQTDLPLAYTKT